MRFLSVSKFVKIEGSGQYALQVRLSLFSSENDGKKVQLSTVEDLFLEIT